MNKQNVFVFVKMVLSNQVDKTGHSFTGIYRIELSESKREFVAGNKRSNVSVICHAGSIIQVIAGPLALGIVVNKDTVVTDRLDNMALIDIIVIIVAVSLLGYEEVSPVRKEKGSLHIYPVTPCLEPQSILYGNILL